VSQSVTYRRPEQLSPAVIQSTLENAGFDVFNGPSPTTDHRNTAVSNAVDRVLVDRRRTHLQQCPLCQEEESRASHDTKVTPSQLPVDLDAIKETSPHDATLTAEKFIYSDSDSKSSVASHVDKSEDGPFRVTLSVGGMTCASCSGTITKMVSELAGVSEVAVSFLAKSATLIVDKRQSVEEVVETVECCGFEAEVMSVEALNAANSDSSLRTLSLRIDGMFCK
jgi:Cu+-exporting ATPase